MNKPRLLFICLVGVLLISMACKREMDSSSHHPYKNTHEYPDPGPAPTTSESGELALDEGNRWIWQKPELVLERLGNLDNKIVADIGAGPYGYFSFRIAAQTPVRKVVAVDIDPAVNEFIEEAKNILPEGSRERIEARLATPNDPMLNEEEVDIILMVNLSFYLADRIDYFKKLQRGVKPGGKIVIIDFKKRDTPIGPGINERIALGQIEAELKEAGYINISSDDRTLDYQYIITAEK